VDQVTIPEFLLAPTVLVVVVVPVQTVEIQAVAQLRVLVVLG
jgi:hypothetical protein